MNDLELQQYLFDTNGYLVIEGALTAAEVAELNRPCALWQSPVEKSAPGASTRS